MSVQTRINAALIARLKQIVLSPDLHIVDSQEDEHTPIVGEPYLSAIVLVGETESLAVYKGKKRYVGILQVTVNGETNAGTAFATGIADEIVDHFEKDTIIMGGDGVRLKIYRQPSQATPTGDGAWLRVPVSIPYQCMA
jgi:hypothetical protein